ncbi:alpha/beta fold hydrolase [Peribacillus sp. NPDC097675]|uniref:alpha/beta fold hydrolase n=1 Tax=Peribacillus sp. NPDC097675 TaxID=3390618 RepID=UPI003CFF7D89
MIIKKLNSNKYGNMQYRIWGEKDKPNLVMFHGLGSTSESWIELAEQLSNYFYVVAVDLPAHGQTTPLREYTIENFNKWTNFFLKSIFNNQKLYVIAHSIGCDLFLNYQSNFASKSFISQMILLDGGYLSEELDFNTPLEDVNMNAESYLETYQFNDWDEFLYSEKQDYRRWNSKIEQFSINKMVSKDGKIKLKMGIKDVKGYAETFYRHPGFKNLNKTDVNTSLLISTLPVEANEIRRKAVARIHNPKVKSFFLEDTTHDMYIDRPSECLRTIKKQLLKSEVNKTFL